MRPVDLVGGLAAAAIGLGLVLDQSTMGQLCLVLVGFGGALVARDRSKAPFAIASCVGMSVIPFSSSAAAFVAVAVAAALGVLAELWSPAMLSRRVESLRARLAQLDVDLVDRHDLLRLSDRELARAGRADQMMAEVTLSITGGPDRIVESMRRLRDLVRRNDIIAFDERSHQAVLLAVVPGTAAAELVSAGVGMAFPDQKLSLVVRPAAPTPNPRPQRQLPAIESRPAPGPKPSVDAGSRSLLSEPAVGGRA